jgi:LPS sulfotransferase NodH
MQSPGSTVVSNSLQPAQARNKAPVFVLGCPRSGTTLLYHMLLSAGNFAIYRGESQVFNLLEPRFGDLSVSRNKRKLLAAWEGSALFTRTGLNAGQIEAEVMQSCQNAGDFLRIVMEAMARKQGVERWADCTPEHLLFLRRIKETIPDALIVHIIRDGRDVALSLGKQKWIRPFLWDRGADLLVAALYWEWIVKRGREDGKKLGPDYYEVRYEELVANPRNTLAQLGTFVGQELDYGRIEQVGIGSVSEPNSSFKNETEAGEFQPVARWRASLSGDRLSDLECLVGKTLAELGYERATAESDVPHRAALKRMRASYRAYFDSKWTLKTRTLLGRFFGARDLSWV